VRGWLTRQTRTPFAIRVRLGVRCNALFGSLLLVACVYARAAGAVALSVPDTLTWDCLVLHVGPRGRLALDASHVHEATGWLVSRVGFADVFL